MNASSIAATPRYEYELRFQSLRQAGRAYAFPCDAAGRVELDALSDRARESYLYARVVVGNELAWPNVLPGCTH